MSQLRDAAQAVIEVWAMKPGQEKMLALPPTMKALTAALALPDAQPVAAALALFPLNIEAQTFSINGGPPLKADGDTKFFSAKKTVDFIEAIHNALTSASAPQPATAPAYLNNGARYKVARIDKCSDAQICGLPAELNGRWVALVAADDDCHLQPATAPEPAGEMAALLADRERLQWCLDLLSGEDSADADAKTMRFAAQLIAGKVGREAVDAARQPKS